MRKPALFILVSLFFCSALAQAADWPQWRGADREDRSSETGLLTAWPSKGPKQLWVNDDGGIGYAGFAIADGRLYTMGAEGDQEFLLVLDANTGKKVGKVKLGPLFTNKWGDGPRGTPTISEGKVYALSSNGHLNCIDLRRGKADWVVKMEDFGGKVPNWGYTESPLVDGNKVIVTPGGKQGALLALDKRTGKKIWQSKDFKDSAQYSSIIAADHNGKRQYIQLVMSNLVGIDAANGDLLWKQAWDGKVAVIPTPIFHDGQVYISSGYGIGCMKIALGPGHTVNQVYKNKNMKNHHGGVIRVEDHLFGYSDGHGWVCQSWESGEIVWREKGALGKGPCTYADGHLYLQDEKSGDIVLIEASTTAWKEKGRFTLDPQTKQRKPDGRIWTHPVIANGKLYLRDQEYIHCYDVSGR